MSFSEDAFSEAPYAAAIAQKFHMMSMARALEVRARFLGHELAEFAFVILGAARYPATPGRVPAALLSDLLTLDIVNRLATAFARPCAHRGWRELRGFREWFLRNLAERRMFQGDAGLRLWSDLQADRPTMFWSRLGMLVALEHWLERNGIE